MLNYSSELRKLSEGSGSRSASLKLLMTIPGINVYSASAISSDQMM